MGILSSIGIGNAQVDLIVPDEEITAGETKQCYVEVDGGTETQEIEDIYAALRTNYLTPEGHHEATIREYELMGAFTIHPDEHREISVELDIPEETPVTRGKTQVWVDTGLEVGWGTDPEDTDVLTVKPSDLVSTLDRAIDTLGYTTEAHEPVATVGTPLAGHGTFAQEMTLHVDGTPTYLVYTVEEGTLIVGIHYENHDGVGPFETGTADTAEIASAIRTLLDKA